jgi:hypothetical protein
MSGLPSVLPLEVHEVLEEEYRTIYDEEPPPSVASNQFEILDCKWACTILEKCGVDRSKLGTPDAVAAILGGFVDGNQNIKALKSSPALSNAGRQLLKDYGKFDKSEKERLNRRIVDDALRGAVKPLRDMRLADLYSELHKKNESEARTALCISGGGIRSATFALGVIQGLASAKILDKFHYLSTVSGGGYIGSWLSSWARRHPKGITGVQDDLIVADSSVRGHASPDSKVEPEPAPVRHLRAYSNYLSPRLGITSGDTWTMVALYLRNVLLNLLVLIPILAALLAVPRIFSLLLHHVEWAASTQPLVWMNVLLGIGFAYIGLARPVEQGRKDELTGISRAFLYILFTIVPLAGAAMFLAAYWAQQAATTGLLKSEQVAPFFGLPLGSVTRWYLLAAILMMTAVPSFFYYVRYFRTSAASRKSGASRQGPIHVIKKISTELAAAVVSVLTAVGLVFLAAIKLFPDPLHVIQDPSRLPFLRPLTDAIGQAHIFLCLAVPVMLLIFFTQASIFVGISGRINEDDDREWWGRAGAYLLFAAVAVALLGVITVYGPLMLFRAPVILASLGGVSGVAAALLGFSAKTPANGKQKDDSGTTAKVMDAASGLIVPIFACILLSAISLGTTWLAEQFNGLKINDRAVAFSSQFQSQATAMTVVPASNQHAAYVLKSESEKTAENSLVDARSIAHLRTIAQTSSTQVWIIVGVAAGALILSLFIGVNKFSMHALYRNRLIRAYLGASRYSRDPDRFTGFDEHDNLQMYELHPDIVWSTTFGDETVFADALVTAMNGDGPAKAVATEIWNGLPFWTRLRIGKKKPVGNLRGELLLAINTVLLDTDLVKIAPDPVLQAISGRARRNRAIINKYFALGGDRKPMPLHVINTALNLTAGEKLAWQQRQAASFTISPLHAGSLYVGYRRSRRYGGADGISIGTAVTISGAAASPNQGYHSSPAMAFLLTLLNVRLGWWLGNPGIAGRRTHRKGHPTSSVPLLANELAGNTSDAYPWVYLSDGGHFENLGIYEMILRRCRHIVVSDAGCDPTFNFEDLGNAMRKIRTDLGVPIDFPRGEFGPRSSDSLLANGGYVVVAPIRYSAVDGPGAKDGTLVYIKPGLYQSEFFPKDVYNYAASSPTFPHETTADQFFSESQFESYRALGRHVINEICGNYGAGARVATVYDSVSHFATTVGAPAAKQPKPEEVVAQHLDRLAGILSDAAIAGAAATEDLAEKVTAAIKEAANENSTIAAAAVLADKAMIPIKEPGGSIPSVAVAAAAVLAEKVTLAGRRASGD